MATPSEDLQRKSDLTCIRGVTCLKWENLVVHVFDYLSASDIWHDKKGGLWWEWPHKRGRGGGGGGGGTEVVICLYMVSSSIFVYFGEKVFNKLWWYIFSSPVSFCHHLASVVRLRLSVVRHKLSHLSLLLWNFSFSRFIPIMQIRHILIKDHI